MMIKRFSLLLIVLVAAAVLTGCNSEQIAQFQARLQDSQADLGRIEKALDAAVNSQAEKAQDIAIMPPGPAREKAVDQYNQTNKVIKISRSAVGGTANLFGELAKELETVTDEAGLIEATGKTIAPYAGGYGPLIVLATGLIGAGIRAVQNRRAGVNAVESLDEVVANLTPAEKAKIIAKQKPATRRLVRYVHGKNIGLPI